MCEKDKSMDGMVGQFRSCYFFQTSSVIKCGISLVLSRYRDLINHYSTVRVRPTLSDITATRMSVLATLLTNRHDNTKLISWRHGTVGGVRQTVNLFFRASRFESYCLHQISTATSVIVVAYSASRVGGGQP
jgi:hypothetical protein